MSFRFLIVMLVGFSLWPTGASSLASGVDDAKRADFVSALADYEKGLSLRESQPSKARGLFRSAAQRFESLVASGIVNGRLEYNLGNCYLQAGDVGLAILHYRRAAKLIPRDDRLKENLKEARSRRLTSINSSPQSTFLRTFFFWHYDTSASERGLFAIVMYVAVWVLLIAYTFSRRRGLWVGALACGAIGLVLASSLATQVWLDRHNPSGVVTSLDVDTYKGPGQSYQKQFKQPLQPGVEFSRIERRGTWWHIKVADGQTGWIDGKNASLVQSFSGLQLAS